MKDTAYLMLEDGSIFQGVSLGAKGTALGELVFTTGMTGYLETLTDPSYYGQIITQTFPLIGNYGVIPEDFESGAASPKGYIVKHWCQDPWNFRCKGDLDTFLKRQNVVGLAEIDTRRLVRILREHGTMNGMITPSLADFRVPLSSYRIKNPVPEVSCEAAYTENPEGIYHILLWDFGSKKNILRELLNRNCKVTVVPWDTTAKEMIAMHPDGILLSNGPGNPTDNHSIIAECQSLLNKKIPMFGICLGHQILALANGFTTEKLKYGHRGSNQPARNQLDGRTYITSQNHGYAVVSNSIDTHTAQEWFVHVNDSSCEGILYRRAPLLSVQFHPEASAGPRDTGFLFDYFLSIVKEMSSHA